MRSSTIIFIISVCLMAGFSIALVRVLYAQDSVSYGGVTYKLPAAKEKIPIPESIPKSHTVVKGDTLWDLAARYLADPYLWPVIWMENMQEVTNPHLIYPGQVLKMPEPKIMLGEKEPKPIDQAEREVSEEAPSLASLLGEPEEPAQETPQPMPEEPSPVETPKKEEVKKPKPLLTTVQVLEGGFVSNKVPPHFRITDMDLATVAWHEHFPVPRSPEDRGYESSAINPQAGTIYFNARRTQVKVGDRFLVYNVENEVIHPLTKERVGRYFFYKGIAETLCVLERIAIAYMIDFSSPVEKGDILIPYQEYASPLTPDPYVKDFCPSEAIGRGIPGVIIGSKNPTGVIDALPTVSKNEFIYIDKGYKEGISPGDIFVITNEGHAREAKGIPFRENLPGEETPPRALGEAVVIRCTENVSTAYITRLGGVAFSGFTGYFYIVR